MIIYKRAEEIKLIEQL